MDHESMSWLLLLLELLLMLGMLEAKVPAVIVFGDSSVDSGNNNYIPTIARSNFQPYGRDFEGGKPTGRFCNGRIATDFVSEAFGIKPTVPAYLDPTYSIKDFATGVCFASAGTGFDNATSDVLSVIPLWKEVEYFKEYQRRLRGYLGNYRAKQIVNEALYMEIYRLGARKISIGGLPPMGCLPAERASNIKDGCACREDYNLVSRQFNSKLVALINKLNSQLKGIGLVLSDIYYTMLEAIEKPHLYGFETVEVGCCGTGIFEMGILCTKSNPLTCTDASKYIFWDAIHGTEKICSILADHLMRTSLAGFL
ncbi:PREDICTED: GDSL esterase/lipase At2g42990-like isoform X2 [Nelumbo nucifera]|uniref:GDSL esterase/lipase At2g42990-like isoform X2 n=1 Tax=Nelumbo nucifera TaxID=4432 RepID=A0A1U7ZVS7_NELNU|nr:PREDICTED: GDSL esterase/lipase At2g42990-like isoform X2 [Nelumbo nucifera]